MDQNGGPQHPIQDCVQTCPTIEHHRFILMFQPRGSATVLFALTPRFSWILKKLTPIPTQYHPKKPPKNYAALVTSSQSSLHCLSMGLMSFPKHLEFFLGSVDTFEVRLIEAIWSTRVPSNHVLLVKIGLGRTMVYHLLPSIIIYLL